MKKFSPLQVVVVILVIATITLINYDWEYDERV